MGFVRSGSRALPQGAIASRRLGAGLGPSPFVSIVTVAERGTTTVALSGIGQYRALLAGGARDCFAPAAAPCPTAAAVALLTLPRGADRTTAPAPGVSGGAPAGTAGSPGS
ncbi:hypothetical protein [Streptomyces sp. NPDC001135]